MRNPFPNLFSSAVYITDDAGRRVEIHRNALVEPSDPDALQSPAAKVQPAPPTRTARVRQLLGYLISLAVSLGCLISILRAVVMGFSRVLSVPWWWGSIILLGCLIILFALWPFTFGRLWSRQVKLWYIAAYVCKGHCAACSYNLLSIDPETDGRRTCSECGAVWNVDLWRSEFPPHTPPRITSKEKRPHVADAVMNLMPLAADLDDPALFAALKAASTPFFAPGKRVSDLVGLVVIALFLAGLYYLGTFFTTPQDRVIPLALATIGMVLVAAYFWARSTASSIASVTRVHNDRIAANTCPCCAHTLPAPTRHGWRTCPQCGGAWQHKRRGLYISWQCETLIAPD